MFYIYYSVIIKHTSTTMESSIVNYMNSLNNIAEGSNTPQDETTNMKKKYVGLLIMLTPIFKIGTPKIKAYASELGKLLLNIINMHNDVVLQELHPALEQLLLFYMQDFTHLKEQTLNTEVYDPRHSNLSEINRCVKALTVDPQEYKIQELKSIILNVV
jgi:hypothetical protein